MAGPVHNFNGMGNLQGNIGIILVMCIIICNIGIIDNGHMVPLPLL